MNKKIKTAIIGAGHVGSHVALSLMNMSLYHEIILIDKDSRKAQSQALDLFDTLAYSDTGIKIYSGGYEDIKDADFLVFAACSSVLCEDRIQELDFTLDVCDEVIPKIKECGFKGKIISISNPCDLIAQYLSMKTGLCVIGTGTMLDSARLRVRIAHELNISVKYVTGFSLGEHGNSQVAAFSTVTVNSLPLSHFKSLDEDTIAKSTNSAGWDIVIGKGCTEFGIGAACAALIKAIANDEKALLPCSVFLPEHKVYASLPCIIGKNGAEEIIMPSLTANEQTLFLKSIEILQRNSARLAR